MTKLSFSSRPTKYRAWTGESLVTVQSLCFNDKGCIWYGPNPHMGWAFVWPDATWTDDDPRPDDSMLKPIMQWIGMQDDKGCDIYEGDIVTIKEIDFFSERGEAPDSKGLIWENVLIKYDGLDVKLRLNEYRADESIHFAERIEVVGNVYQTP